MTRPSLREYFKDWVDIDGAQYCLAVNLGILDESINFAKAKHIFWTANPLGEMLYNILEQMTAMEILEKRDEPDFQYRWNAAYKAL